MRVCLRFIVVVSASILLTNSWALSQINLPGFGQKSASSNDQKANKLLHDKLPLVLDANTAYPTVLDEDLLGGRFNGRVLPLTVETLTKPLPPGDYIIPMTFFCSEYSVHRGGNGIAYELGPAQGTAARAISTLLWRGMLTGHKPQELQSVSWAIQGSVAYDKMPPKYRALVDQLIPDMKNEVNGQAFADIEDGFQGKVNRTTKKLSDAIGRGTGGFVNADIKVDVELNESFQRLGQIGHSALDAEKLNTIFTTAFASDADREEALYAGQGQQSSALPAANGPWSVKVPGVAYMRFIVHGGNLQSDNVMQIRILPLRSSQAQVDGSAHLVLIGLQENQQNTLRSPSLLSLFNGSVNEAALSQCQAMPSNRNMCTAQAITVGGNAGYSIGTVAQAPIMAPSAPIGSTPTYPSKTTQQLHITMAGADITNRPQMVVVGQPITLQAIVTGSSALQNPQWTIEGNNVAGYSLSRESGKATPTILNDTVAQYYWTDQGQQRTVTVSGTLDDGQTHSASATFSVVGPTRGSAEDYGQGRVIIFPNKNPLSGKGFKQDQQPGWWSMFGSPLLTGVRLHYSRFSGPDGKYEWFQFVINDRSSNSPPKTCVVDGATLPYEGIVNDNLVDSPGQFLGPFSRDSKLPPIGAGNEVTRDFTARSYLMWQSTIPDSIPVALGYIQWRYSVDAVYDGEHNTSGGWDLVSKDYKVGGYHSSTILPRWTTLSRNSKGEPLTGVCPD